MASNNQVPAVVLLALILFAAANPLSHAQRDRTTNLLSGLNVHGLLCCTGNGSCPAGAAGLAGVRVGLVCTNILGVAVTVGQNTTTASGGFIISVSNLVGGLLNPTSLPCNVVVRLPLSQTICPVLSAVNGTLTGALSTVKDVTTVVGGLVGCVTVLSFTYTGSVTV